MPDKYENNRMFVMVPIISCPIFRPTNAHLVMLISGVRRKISCMPLAIVMATSITAPREPIRTEERNTSLGGKVKKLIVSNFKPLPSVSSITN